LNVFDEFIFSAGSAFSNADLIIHSHYLLSDSVIYAYDLTGDGINDIVFIKHGDEVYAIDTTYAFVLSSFALSPLTEETH